MFYGSRPRRQSTRINFQIVMKHSQVFFQLVDFINLQIKEELQNYTHVKILQ
jgi:hypothetical protein